MMSKFVRVVLTLCCVLVLFVVYMSVKYTGRGLHFKKRLSNSRPFLDMDHTFVSNEHNFSYTISESNACRQKESIFLLVIVCISPANIFHRQTIRETWGSIVTKDPNVKLMFLLGNPGNVSIQSDIMKESAKHRDIIQEDFVDSYRNLSIKSVALLKWVSRFCAEAEYILKADDDMFIHIPNLVSMLKNTRPSNAVIGYVNNGAVPIRDPTSKWYASYKEYSRILYPSYCSGTAYVLTKDSIGPIYNVSQHVNMFWLEDIFITGICRRLAKVQIINRNEFTYLKREPTACSFKRAVSGHRYSLTEIQKIWTEIQNNVQCPK